jgi:hypothetical protein
MGRKGTFYLGKKSSDSGLVFSELADSIKIVQSLWHAFGVLRLSFPGTGKGMGKGMDRIMYQQDSHGEKTNQANIIALYLASNRD